MIFPKLYLSLLNSLKENPFLIVCRTKYENSYSYYLIRNEKDWQKALIEIYEMRNALSFYAFSDNFIKDIKLADSQDKKVFYIYQLLTNRSNKGYEYEEFNIEYFVNSVKDK